MKIVLKKIAVLDVVILQDQVLKYIENKTQFLNYRNFDKYCFDLIAIENLEAIFKVLRTKIETDKPKVNISLSISQSVVLHKCYSDIPTDKTKQTFEVMLRLGGQLHKSLINI